MVGGIIVSYISVQEIMYTLLPRLCSKLKFIDSNRTPVRLHLCNKEKIVITAPEIKRDTYTLEIVSP